MESLEAAICELAGPMTANQLDRFARAHRTVTEAAAATTRLRRRLTWRHEEDGSPWTSKCHCVVCLFG